MKKRFARVALSAKARREDVSVRCARSHQLNWFIPLFDNPCRYCAAGPFDWQAEAATALASSMRSASPTHRRMARGVMRFQRGRAIC